MKTVKIKPTSPDQGEFVVINASDFNPNIHELCDGESLDGEKITVTLSAETAPELQQAINDAKAECESVAAENTWLKEQLATSQGEFIAFKNDVAAMQARIDELKSVDYSKLKVDELKDVLKLKGIEFPSDAKKDDLLALLPKE
ncbi:MAG: HeH/LEM domain-containing protein [Acinetobacter sp.]|nr:HeH/LEM domain-containing protein [Acinetobacter sp.]MDN5511151.1 HeH/LEM domain-containing protein [Acinetobacter sp.]MDN5523956.1 HeH/LEM domain-containing protein [Acinetobacter sp.]